MEKLCWSLILIFCKLFAIAAGSSNLSACWIPVKYFNHRHAEPHGLEPYRNDLNTNQPVYAARLNCFEKGNSNCGDIIHYYPAEMTDFRTTKDMQVLTYPPGSMSWLDIKNTPNHGMPLIAGGRKRKNKFLCRYRSTKQRLIIGSYVQGESSCTLKYQGRTIKRNTFETLVINLYGKALGLEQKATICHKYSTQTSSPSLENNLKTPETNDIGEDAGTEDGENDDGSREIEEEGRIFDRDSIQQPCWHEIESLDTDNQSFEDHLSGYTRENSKKYLARLIWPRNGNSQNIAFGTYLPSEGKIRAFGGRKSNGKPIVQILILPNDSVKWLRSNQKVIMRRRLPGNALIVDSPSGDPFPFQKNKLYYAVCRPAIPNFSRRQQETPIGIINSEEGLCAVWFGGQMIYFTQFHILTTAKKFHENGHVRRISFCNSGKIAASESTNKFLHASNTQSNFYAGRDDSDEANEDADANDNTYNRKPSTSSRNRNYISSMKGNSVDGLQIFGSEDKISMLLNDSDDHPAALPTSLDKRSRIHPRTRSHHRAKHFHQPKNLTNPYSLNYHSEETT